jgi:glutathione peroxidase
MKPVGILFSILVASFFFGGSAIAAGKVSEKSPTTSTATAGTCGADLVAEPSFYDLKVKSVEGEAVNLATYKGKVALVVNTASRCGYTSQYKDLQAVFAKYKEQGLVVLGFPSNDFGGQEPGTNKDIKAFCETNFNVKFPLFEKAPVTGKEIQPAFKFLTSNSSSVGPVEWNFEKFLVDRNGKVVGRFKSKVSPSAKEVSSLIEDKLKEKSTCTSSI